MKALRKFGILSGVVLAGGAIVVPFSTSCGNKVKNFGTFIWEMSTPLTEWPETIASAVTGYETAVAVIFPSTDYGSEAVLTYLELIEIAADASSAYDSPFMWSKPGESWYSYSGQPGEYTLKILAIHVRQTVPFMDKSFKYLGYLNVIVQ